ncbi:PqqD family protein [Thermoflavimicrobium dichotomicum]|uniref:Coenzyme PQQ synthesis protein D (PqqD) n=1 Tax=Thermoflavimicrobium dichotomicum TaxID=46223 RepID=A0A1I3PRW1_9BACL|nr:PqqD family protein [Thermoflavimicrobium dichotomicum]SFJ24122.1 Coenzyme PQQ synthesis protein D (PqqD) [Thermoflavimicrobium dichotomicum]
MPLTFRRKKTQENLMEKRPLLKSMYQLEPIGEETELLQVVIPRTSWIERFSIRYLKQPTHIRVRLDRLGSFVIAHCDGKHRVKDIEEKISSQFGEEAEPVLPRLVQFLRIIEANGWITWKVADQ